MKIAVNQQTGGDGTTETGAGTTTTANVPASRWCRRHTAVLAAGAALSTAVACGLGATAIASAAPTHAQQAFGSSARHVVERATATLASPEVMLPAGKVGTRSQIPWGQVGSGWALAEYTKATIRRARMVTLYLIDPAGGMYSEYRWPSSKSAWNLVDWSGDKARALFTGPAAGHQVAMHQLMLATGKVVTTATCTITVVNRSTGMRMAVPVATMYSAEQGPSSWHYGNNVTLPPGAYDVIATANGERVTFHVTNPKM